MRPRFEGKPHVRGAIYIRKLLQPDIKRAHQAARCDIDSIDTPYAARSRAQRVAGNSATSRMRCRGGAECGNQHHDIPVYLPHFTSMAYTTSVNAPIAAAQVLARSAPRHPSCKLHMPMVGQSSRIHCSPWLPCVDSAMGIHVARIR